MSVAMHDIYVIYIHILRKTVFTKFLIIMPYVQNKLIK